MMQQCSRFFSLPKRFFLLTILSVGFFFLLMHFANVGLSQSVIQSDALQKDTKQSSDTKNSENPHWLGGSYYTIGNGIEAKLLLNNKGPRPIEVRPTLYNLSGQMLEIAPVIVESNSHRFINLQDWANLGGESFQSGSIKLFHTGKDLVLGAQIYLTDEAHSLSFEEKLAELGKFDSRRQEAVWFQPTNQTETQIILSNTSDTNLSITARLSKKPQQTGDANVFQLNAHETKVLDLRRDFSDGQQFANVDIVGLSLEHTGAKSALQARVLVRDAGRGYSNFAQFSNPNGGKSSEYQGVGFHVDEIDGNRLEPIVIARNVGARAANVSVEIPYTREDGTSGTVSLPAVNLQAGEMRSFNLKRVAQVSRREQIQIAGIEVKYDTAPGSVIVAAHSADRDNNLVFRVPMWDPLQQKSPTGGYPWRIEETSTTQTYIKNTTDQEQDYVAFLLWAGGGEYMIGRKTIAAHKTVEIDVKRLRDEQIPDFRGRTIPLNVEHGQLQWTLKRIDNLPDDDQRANLALIGRSEQIDLINKTSSNYACQNCCESSASAYVTADPFGYRYSSYEFEVGDVVQFYAFEEIWTCYQSPNDPPQIYPRNSSNWRSSNTNIATVTSSGLVTIQGAGEVEIGTDFWVSFSYSNGECPPGPYLTECKDGELPKTETEETNKAELLLPECGTCSNRSRRVSPDANITAKPKVTINVPATAQDGDTVDFSVTVQGGTPTAYLWSFEPTSGGNNPQVNFTAPTAATTQAKAHWFAKPDSECGASFDSKYTIEVKVTFEGRSPITKKAPFTVSVGRNWGGKVLEPSTLAPAGTLDTAFDNERGLWVVVGRGRLERVPSPIVMREIPETSQFYYKVHRHEEVHVEQYATGIWSDLYQIDNVMPRLFQLSDPNKQILEQKAFEAVEKWHKEQDQILEQRLPQGEREAYAVSDPIAPKYIFNNCGRF